MRAYGSTLARFAWLGAAANLALAAPPIPSFLSPQRYTTPVGESVALRVDAGLAKSAAPADWPTDRVEWFVVRGGPNQENRDAVQPERAGDNSVAVEIKPPGVTLIGLDQRPAVIELTGAELREFIAENTPGAGTADKLPAADAKVRVRCVSSAKTLVRAASDKGEPTISGIATSKTGQAAEIKPNFDPTASRVGTDLPLTVYVDGAKVSKVKVQATHVGSGKATSFVSDNGGAGHFRISDTGVWRVEFHRVQPLQGDPAADWVIYSGTLTFEVTKGAGK